MDWSRTQLPICVFSTFRQFFTFDRSTERVEEIISIRMSLTEKPENVEGHVVELRPDVYKCTAHERLTVHSGFPFRFTLGSRAAVTQALKMVNVPRLQKTFCPHPLCMGFKAFRVTDYDRVAQAANSKKRR